MSKFYFIIFAFLLVTFKAVSQDTLNLVQPSNLQAFLQDNIVQLSWQAPVDTTTSNDTIPPGLSGYRIYCNNVLIGNTAHPTLTFFDTNPDSAVSFYKVTALYDLAFYGFPGDTAESVPSNLVYAVTGWIQFLSFEENFTTGIFETNQWTPESENWRIEGQSGNPAPSASYNYNPLTTNYSASLTSPWLDASGYTDGQIFIDVDLKAQITNPTATEFLYVDVFNGSDWIPRDSITNRENTVWISKKIDITEVAFGIPFRIRFRAQGLNTANIMNWLIDNIRVYRECAVPLEFSCSLDNPTHQELVKLEWEAPTPGHKTAWLEWDSGENSDAVGLTNGGTFSAAIRFTPIQLLDFVGSQLTKIKLFPYAAGGQIVLKVWTGPNAAQLITSQPILEYTAGEWNEFILDIPVPVTGTQELWIGYQITHDPGIYVAGNDAGPAVVGYGDLISTDGILWESMSQAYGLDFNWNLAGFVTAGGFEKKLNNIRSLEGYNIYKNDEFLAFTTETEYLDNLSGGVNCYNVTAVYSDCESAFSNTDCMVVGVTDHDLNTIEIFPNPASSLITVALTGDINQLIFTDMTGRKVKQLTITPGTTTIPIDVSEFAEGMYVVRFITKTGESGARKLLIDR